jgi:hypothetical protein
MNETTSQFPPDSEFVRAWHQAAHDLGLSAEAPFTLTTAEGEFAFPAFVRHFGSPLGTLVLSGAVRGHDRRAYAAARAAGYFVSVLSDSYACYGRQLIIDTLNDWQFFGSEAERPAWYSGASWS